VFGAALAATPSSIGQVVDAWGRGFWDLIPFTLQMALVIITGHVLAIAAPMGALIKQVAGWPRTPAAPLHSSPSSRWPARGSTGASA
jgi:short-chain fatty acids transporter